MLARLWVKYWDEPDMSMDLKLGAGEIAGSSGRLENTSLVGLLDDVSLELMLGTGEGIAVRGLGFVLRHGSWKYT